MLALIATTAVLDIQRLAVTCVGAWRAYPITAPPFSARDIAHFCSKKQP
jgi:hypothetical protein